MPQALIYIYIYMGRCGKQRKWNNTFGSNTDDLEPRYTFTLTCGLDTHSFMTFSSSMKNYRSASPCLLECQCTRLHHHAYMNVYAYVFSDGVGDQKLLCSELPAKRATRPTLNRIPVHREGGVGNNGVGKTRTAQTPTTLSPSHGIFRLL